MQEEYNSLKAQATWILVPPPDDRAMVRSEWVYKVKNNSNAVYYDKKPN